jgi:hypothetical protein
LQPGAIFTSSAVWVEYLHDGRFFLIYHFSGHNVPSPITLGNDATFIKLSLVEGGWVLAENDFGVPIVERVKE